MQPANVLEQTVPAYEAPVAPEESDYVLNVTTIHQDLATREWAAEMCNRLTQMAGSGNIRVGSWSLSDLTQPEILVDAVHSAAHANVIVIAVSAADELPLDLRAWIDLWLPLRTGGGALVALMGLPGEPGHQVPRTREHLRAVASKSGLAFLPEERMLPVTPPDPFDVNTSLEIPDALTPGFTETVTAGHNDDGYLHWGLNE
ncbi:MAG: hypothetical protein ABSA45_01815 [Verrucomicrobiota bacterium]|jgi:hypothetical protein